MVPSCRIVGLDEFFLLKAIHLFINIFPVDGITLYANLLVCLYYYFNTNVLLDLSIR